MTVRETCKCMIGLLSDIELKKVRGPHHDFDCLLYASEDQIRDEMSRERRLTNPENQDQQPWEPWWAEHIELLVPTYWAIRDNYSRLALCFAEVDKDRIIADHKAARDGRIAVEALREIRDNTTPAAMEEASTETRFLAIDINQVAEDALSRIDAAPSQQKQETGG